MPKIGAREFFKHDFFAREDAHIIALIRARGWAAYGIFWALIEKIYEAGGSLPDAPADLAYSLQADTEIIAAILASGMFRRCGGKISSPRASVEIEHRRLMHEALSDAGRHGYARKSSLAQARLKRGLSNKEKEKEKEKERTSANATAFAGGFAEFWAAYPRKRDKGTAIRAWAKLKASEELQKKILASVEEQKNSADWLKDSGKYIPYPASWINGRRWEDEPADNDGGIPNRRCQRCGRELLLGAEMARQGGVKICADCGEGWRNAV